MDVNEFKLSAYRLFSSAAFDHLHILCINQTMSKRDKIILVSVLAGIIFFVSYDIWSDFQMGSPLHHMITELIVVFLSSLAAVFVLAQNNTLRQEVRTTQNELVQLQLQATKWKKENQDLIHGLSEAIDRQMQEWNYTAAEKEVALLLLKGLSFKEIANIRDSAEKTVRHHAQKIYEKSNLAGRAELSAFFLEDLLQF